MGALVSRVESDMEQAKNVINSTIPYIPNSSSTLETIETSPKLNQTDLTSNGQIGNDLVSRNDTANYIIRDSPQDSSGDDFILNIFGYDVKPFQWVAWTKISPFLGHLSAAAMVIGCVMPYVPQYWNIHKTHNSSGFSIFVCLALLIANISRVAFWYVKGFSIALLIQSMVMIMAQLMLLEICVRYKRTTKEKTLFNSPIKEFWAWSDLLSYIEFLFIYSITIGIMSYFLRANLLYVEVLGTFALMIEAMLAMPQMIKNFKKKSVIGLSVGMVLMWMLGDTYKLVYFIIEQELAQFKACAMIQITIDIIIIIQILVFSHKQTASDQDGSQPMKNIVSS